MLQTSRRGVLFLLFLCVNLLSAEAAAQTQQTADAAGRIERLVALGKLWGAVKYFHPYLGYRDDIDWDKAAVEAITKVNQAKTSADYAAAVEGMLQALGDPVTKVAPPPAKYERSEGAPPDPSFRALSDGTLVVSLRNFADEFEFNRIVTQTYALKKEILKAKAVIFDLRPPGRLTDNQQDNVATVFQFSDLANALTSSPAACPGERRRMHVGFAPQRGPSSGGYESAFFVAQRAMIVPDPSAKSLPIVFLVNRNSVIPPAVLALQAAGKAALVAEGALDESSAVSTRMIKLTDGVGVQIRLGELIYPNGTTGLAANETVPVSSQTGEQNPAFQRALALAQNFKISPPGRRSIVASAAITPEKPYAEMAYPSPEYRVLAAFRIWTVINYFSPYKDLIGEDWDGVLREFIPRLEHVGSALEYNLTIAEMVTRFHDGHGFVRSEALREYLGIAPAPVNLQIIEGAPVVIGFLNDLAAKEAKEAGVGIGDVILKVDGEDAKERLVRLGRYLSGSTPQWSEYRAARTLLNGPEGSAATVTVRDAKDQVKEVKFSRKRAYFEGDITERRGEPYKLLSAEIGYADLDRLEVSMVDDMFEKFRNTKAIIFDDRTYPRGTAWAIAPRLTDKDQPVAALFTRRVPMVPDSPSGEIASSTTSQTFEQRIPHTDKWKYKGKTVMLIDERAISQAEHSGLFLEAANGTKFIGSPTAGANGDVTAFCVPGGIWISFTGQGVRHADGRQLQRVGLTPDIEVRPTIQGVRAGRDEVLDKAIEYLKREMK